MLILDRFFNAGYFKGGERIFNGYFIFVISFLFHALTIFQGIDLTDLGFHLTTQVSSARIPIDVQSIWIPAFLTKSEA